MAAQNPCLCPRCGGMVRADVEENAAYTCSLCRRTFTVMLDPQSGTAAFIEQQAHKLPEPLYLPKGSIRALTTLLTAASSWVLIFVDRDVPGYLFSLLLTITGYYFGFRTKVKSAESRIYDAAARAQTPLHAPGSAIRVFLILGFAASAFVIYSRGRLGDAKYIEFFVVLAGLVVGYLFRRVVGQARETPTYVAFSHVKGAVVIAAALALTCLVLSGNAAQHTRLALSLAAVVSFYFGSRT